MLSGDAVHFHENYDSNGVPSFNYDVAQSGQSIDKMKELAEKTGAKVWVNHDRDQQAAIPKAPAYVE